MALGLPQDSLGRFPEAFRVGMAARADKLRDHGPNDPKNWEQPFGTGEIHIGVSVFSDSEDDWRDACRRPGSSTRGSAGVTVLMTQDFGAQPGDLNPLGYKDSIGQPAIEGSGVEPLPGQGRPIKAGEFILGYPGEAGVPLPMPRPDVLGRNGTFVGLRKYQSRVGDVQPVPARARRDRAGAGAARGQAGGPLAQRRALDARARPTTTRRWAPTPTATTTSPMPPIRTAGRCRSARTCGA